MSLNQNDKINGTTLLLMFIAMGCSGSPNAINAKQPPPTATPQTQQTTPAPGPATLVKSDYQVMTAQQLFASQYSTVDAICSAYAVDAAEIDASAKPVKVVKFAVFPNADQPKLDVQSPKSTLTASISLQASLETWDMTVNGQIVSQEPIVIMNGSSTISFTGGPHPAGADDTIGMPLVLSDPATDETVDSEEFSYLNPSNVLTASARYRLDCHLVSQPAEPQSK